MTVLQSIQNSCLVIGIDQPTLVYGSADRQSQELGYIANKAVKQIFQDNDWQNLREIATLTGDGNSVDFDLPDNYSRMLNNSNLYSESFAAPYQHYSDTDQWLYLDVVNFDFVINAWTLFGNQIHIKPAPEDGIDVNFFYMNRNKVLDASQVEKVEFTADDDEPNIAKDDDGIDDLFERCIIYKWLQFKKQPYSQEMEDYEDLRGKLATTDKGSRILRIGRTRYPWGVNFAYPWSIDPS